MTDKSHDDVFRQTGLVAARYEGHARAMKAEMAESDAFEEKPPSFSGHRWHYEGDLAFPRFKAGEKWSKLVCERRSELLSSFGVKGDGASFKIDVRKRQARLREATALIPGNCVGNLHPLGRCAKRFENDLMLRRTDRRLNCNRLFSDAETRTRIVVGKTGFNCFSHHNAEQLHLMQSGIVATGGKTTVRVGVACFPPVDEIPHMLSGQLTWRNNIPAVQKRADVPPAVEITVICFGRRLVTLF
jgi:hypothetical protein